MRSREAGSSVGFISTPHYNEWSSTRAKQLTMAIVLSNQANTSITTTVVQNPGWWSLVFMFFGASCIALSDIDIHLCIDDDLLSFQRIFLTTWTLSSQHIFEPQNRRWGHWSCEMVVTKTPPWLGSTRSGCIVIICLILLMLSPAADTQHNHTADTATRMLCT